MNANGTTVPRPDFNAAIRTLRGGVSRRRSRRAPHPLQSWENAMAAKQDKPAETQDQGTEGATTGTKVDPDTLASQPSRVVLEQPEEPPAVYYGDAAGAIAPPAVEAAAHEPTQYEPFDW